MTKTRRVYERGRALNNDLRQNTIQDIVENGGDFVTGFFPGNSSEIALKNRTKYDTVEDLETILRVWYDQVSKSDRRIKTPSTG